MTKKATGILLDELEACPVCRQDISNFIEVEDQNPVRILTSVQNYHMLQLRMKCLEKDSKSKLLLKGLKTT